MYNLFVRSENYVEKNKVSDTYVGFYIIVLKCGFIT